METCYFMGAVGGSGEGSKNKCWGHSTRHHEITLLIPIYLFIDIGENTYYI